MKSLPWIPASIWTLFLFASLLYIPEWRQSLSTWLSNSYFLYTLIGFSIIGAGRTLLYFFKQVHNFKLFRLAGLLTGIALTATLLILLNNPVERIHVLQYGVLAALLHIAFRKNNSGVATFLLAGLLTFNLGIMDEWIQYFLPDRVGDLEDVWLNGASGCGILLIALALDKETSFKPLLLSGEIRRVCQSVAFSLLILAAFITGTTQPGYRHEVEAVGVFYSRYTLDEIRAMDQHILENPSLQNSLRDLYPDKMHDPEHRSRISPFHLEVLTHLFRRDRHDSRGTPQTAFKENQILMRYFPVTLKVLGREWSQEKRASIKQRTGELPTEVYVSPVSRGELWVHGYRSLWAGVLGLAGALFVMAYRVKPKNPSNKPQINENRAVPGQKTATQSRLNH